MPHTTRRNLDRNRDPRRDEHAPFTQWMLDELGSDLIELWSLGEQPGASNFVGAKAGKAATINGTWSLGDTPITWDGADVAQPNGSNGYADAGNDEDLDFADGEPFTLGLFVRRSPISSAEYLFSKTDTSFLGWITNFKSDGTIRMRLDDGSNTEVVTTTSAIDDGDPHFVAVTFDGTDALQIFVDGTLDAISTQAFGSLENTGFVEIGRRADDANYYNGQIGYALACSKALTSTTIERIWARGNIS